METTSIKEAELTPDTNLFLEELIKTEETKVEKRINANYNHHKINSSVIGSAMVPYSEIENTQYQEFDMHKRTLMFLGQVYDQMSTSINHENPEDTQYINNEKFLQVRNAVAQILWRFKTPFVPKSDDQNIESKVQETTGQVTTELEPKYVSMDNIRYGDIKRDGTCVARDIRYAHELGLATSEIPSTSDLDKKAVQLNQNLTSANSYEESRIKSELSGISLTPVFYDAELTPIGKEIYNAAVNAGVDTYIKEHFRV